jgi:hypothetical protein
VIRIVVVLDVEAVRTPAELRAYFLEQIRAALVRTDGQGLFDHEFVAELWRALPAQEPRK